MFGLVKEVYDKFTKNHPDFEKERKALRRREVLFRNLFLAFIFLLAYFISSANVLALFATIIGIIIIILLGRKNFDARSQFVKVIDEVKREFLPEILNGFDAYKLNYQQNISDLEFIWESKIFKKSKYTSPFLIGRDEVSGDINEISFRVLNIDFASVDKKSQFINWGWRKSVFYQLKLNLGFDTSLLFVSNGFLGLSNTERQRRRNNELRKIIAKEGQKIKIEHKVLSAKYTVFQLEQAKWDAQTEALFAPLVLNLDKIFGYRLKLISIIGDKVSIVIFSEKLFAVKLAKPVKDMYPIYRFYADIEKIVKATEKVGKLTKK